MWRIQNSIFNSIYCSFLITTAKKYLEFEWWRNRKKNYDKITKSQLPTHFYLSLDYFIHVFNIEEQRKKHNVHILNKKEKTWFCSHVTRMFVTYTCVLTVQVKEGPYKVFKRQCRPAGDKCFINHVLTQYFLSAFVKPVD